MEIRNQLVSLLETTSTDEELLSGIESIFIDSDRFRAMSHIKRMEMLLRPGLGKLSPVVDDMDILYALTHQRGWEVLYASYIQKNIEDLL